MSNLEIKIGDLVLGSYKFGCVSGIVKEIKKNIVIVDKYQQWYNEYYPLNVELNITIKRIFQVNPPNAIIYPREDKKY